MPAEEDEMKQQEILPLFPLSKVLFPRMILPLHIFEERYKLMISELLASGGSFGVVQDEEVHSGIVGTTASLQKVLHTYEDGRMDILTHGEERFRVIEMVESKPYIRALVDPLIDDSKAHSVARIQIEQMLSLYRQFIARLGLEAEQKQQLDSLMEDMEAERDISYVIGQTIGLDTARQQELLAVTSPSARIELLTDELKRHDTVHKLARNLFEESDFDPGVN